MTALSLLASALEPCRRGLNRALDALVRPRFHLLGKSRSAFRVCGSAGVVLAIALALALVAHRGLSPLVMLWVSLAAIAAFLAQAMITKIVSGEELIYYRHEIAVMLSAALLLRLLGEPVLPYLDATLLGIGLFLACGRVGCLMVGCCYGRPSRWGVRYRPEHAEEGFTRCYVHVRLFPTQPIESVFVFAIVAAGAWMVFSGRPPGAALAFYVIAYDIARFLLEFLRGDAVRMYWKGFSEGQWTSLALMVLVAGLEVAGHLPLQTWHLAATAGLALFMAAAALRRRLKREIPYRLLQPTHVQELAQALQRESTAPDSIQVGCTSLGIRISSGRIEEPRGALRHYSLSSRDGPMSEEAARALGQVVVGLRPAAAAARVVKGRSGVFHLLISD